MPNGPHGFDFEAVPTWVRYELCYTRDWAAEMFLHFINRGKPLAAPVDPALLPNESLPRYLYQSTWFYPL